MLQIEISYTLDHPKNGFPEHYGYYDNIEDAKKALDEIEKISKSEED